MEKGMVLESISMLAELVIEETGKMTWKMATDFGPIKMENTTKASGWTTKEMDQASTKRMAISL